jgi:hypothetical protein
MIVLDLEQGLIAFFQRLMPLIMRNAN